MSPATMRPKIRLFMRGSVPGARPPAILDVRSGRSDPSKMNRAAPARTGATAPDRGPYQTRIGGHMMQTRERARTRLRLRFATAALLAAAAAACSKSDGGTAPSANQTRKRSTFTRRRTTRSSARRSTPRRIPREGGVLHRDDRGRSGGLPDRGRRRRADAPLRRRAAGDAVRDRDHRRRIAALRRRRGGRERVRREGGDLRDARVGGAPSVVAGTQGTAPRGIQAMGDTVYFSGTKDGAPTVFAMPLAGGPTALATGEPLRDPAASRWRRAARCTCSTRPPGSRGRPSVLAIEGGRLTSSSATSPSASPAGSCSARTTRRSRLGARRRDRSRRGARHRSREPGGDAVHQDRRSIQRPGRVASRPPGARLRVGRQPRGGVRHRLRPRVIAKGERT